MPAVTKKDAGADSITVCLNMRQKIDDHAYTVTTFCPHSGMQPTIARVTAMPNPVSLGLLSWAGKLRFPVLFKLTAALFAISMILPDPIPFVDEILFGLGALLLANWKKRKEPAVNPVIDGKR